jgi:hypothetical protein
VVLQTETQVCMLLRPCTPMTQEARAARRARPASREEEQGWQLPPTGLAGGKLRSVAPLPSSSLHNFGCPDAKP